jgi:hypothetical protein
MHTETEIEETFGKRSDSSGALQYAKIIERLFSERAKTGSKSKK